MPSSPSQKVSENTSFPLINHSLCSIKPVHYFEFWEKSSKGKLLSQTLLIDQWCWKWVKYSSGEAFLWKTHSFALPLHKFVHSISECFTNNKQSERHTRKRKKSTFHQKKWHSRNWTTSDFNLNRAANWKDTMSMFFEKVTFFT